MDEIKRLENQIKELERELEKQNSEMQKCQQKMDNAYRQLLKSTTQKEEQLVAKCRELEKLTKNLPKELRQNDQKKAVEANNYMADAAATYKDIEKKPHEKFFPKRLQNFYNTIKEARMLHKSGLYEAAMAIAVSAKTGLNRLGYEIDEQYEEWKREYFTLKNKVEFLELKLSEEINVWNEYTKTKGGNDKARIEINYWSLGEYDTILSRLGEFKQITQKADEMGLDNYINSESSLGTDELKKHIEELDGMANTFEGMSVLYKQRYDASCERSDWGESIVDFLENEINLTWLEDESHFKKAIDAGAEYKPYMEMKYGDGYEQVDFRQWLELTFDNAMGSRIYIYILPYEKENHVDNRLVIYIDYNGAENADYSRQIYTHVKESIQLSEDDGIINFATDVNTLTTNINASLRETGKAIESKIKKSH